MPFQPRLCPAPPPRNTLMPSCASTNSGLTESSCFIGCTPYTLRPGANLTRLMVISLEIMGRRVYFVHTSPHDFRIFSPLSDSGEGGRGIGDARRVLKFTPIYVQVCQTI